MIGASRSEGKLGHNDIFLYIPNVVAAIVVLVLGFLLGSLLSAVVRAAALALALAFGLGGKDVAAEYLKRITEERKTPSQE